MNSATDAPAPVALLVATRSAGKMRELQPLLAEAGVTAESLADARLAEEPGEAAIECFDNFERNALAKARWFAARAGHRAVLAEDSGLEVTALGGRPGVRSKRWSGAALDGTALDAANNALLVASLRGVADRSARYVCVAVIVEGARVWTARGETLGSIVDAPRGANGFGYDPHFWSDDLRCTFGEATRDAKARVSHRARAVRTLLAAWMARGG